MQQQENFNGLDDTLKSFIKNSAEGETALTKLVNQQAAETRAFVNAESYQLKQELQGWRIEEANQAACEQLLQSLKCEYMNLRLNAIEERHDETFEWISNEDPEAPYSSLPGWLEAGQGMYWISGKAGSGKSTLMKFLCRDSRTHRSLQNWQEGTIIPSFFFWRSGSAVQRSSKGLLTSLLYQLLQDDARISRGLLTHTPSLKQKHTIADWSAKEATEILLHSLTIAESPVCFFLDGLDEFDDDEGCGKLLEIIDRMLSSKHGVPLKICVSSRPEPELRRKLERFPSLRLQDLTKHDMEIYANDILREAPAERLPVLVKIVLHKADGVFLWAHYALRSLVRGLSQHDDWNELEKRLKALPSKIEELYHDMWRRLNEDHIIYREEAAQYFHIALELRRPSIFRFMTAVDPLLQEKFLERQSPVLAEDLVRQCEKTEQRLLTRCAGLLEINGGWDAAIEDEESGSETNVGRNEQDRDHSESQVLLSPFHLVLLKRFAVRGTISFLHRTARDFLTDTEAGRDILRHYSPPLAAWQTMWLRVELVDMLASLTDLDSRLPLAQMAGLLSLKRLDFSQKDGIGILQLMHRVYQCLASPNPPKLIIGYSKCHVPCPRWRLFGGCFNYHRDFLGVAASYGMTTYLRGTLSQHKDGLRVRTDFLDYLLLCSSLGPGSTVAELVCLLLDQGADPNVEGFYPIPEEILHMAHSPLPALVTLYYDFPIIDYPTSIHLSSSHLVDIIKVFLARGLDVSKKVLMSIRNGRLTHFHLLNRYSFDDHPALIYETTIGDVAQTALVTTGNPSDTNLMDGHDYAKTRRILLVRSGGYHSKPRKVSNEEDATLLNESLAAYLSVISALVGGSDYPNDMDTPEYVRLAETVTEVDARSEPVDVFEMLMQMGYMKPRDYDFSPGELFEKIPVDAVSGPGTTGVSGDCEVGGKQESRLQELDDVVEKKDRR